MHVQEQGFFGKPQPHPCCSLATSVKGKAVNRLVFCSEPFLRALYPEFTTVQGATYRNSVSTHGSPIQSHAKCVGTRACCCPPNACVHVPHTQSNQDLSLSPPLPPNATSV